MDKKQFLDLIRQIESSGGKDLDHTTIKSGIHKGDAAIGGYGIMPNTAQEFIKRRELKGQIGPDEALVQQMNPTQLKEFLSNQRRIEENLAEDIADRVLTRSNGDEEKAAYMWNQGHNKLASEINKDMLDSSGYIKKFRGVRDLVDKNKKSTSKK
jgi:hypothetical protein